MVKRTVNATLLAHFGQQFGAQAALLLKLTPEVGTEIYLTTWSLSLGPFSAPFANTYKPVFNCSEIVFGVGDSPGSADVEVSLKSPSDVNITDVRDGVYRGARFDLAVCDPTDVTTDPETIMEGTVGAIEVDDVALSVLFELRDLLESASSIMVERYQPTCLEVIGGPRCLLPVLPHADLTHITVRANSTAYVEGDFIRVFQAGSWNNRNFECTTAGTSAGTPPTFDLVIGNTTADGTAVFTTREAWAIEATVASVSGQDITVTVTLPSWATDNSAFRQGLVVFDGGNNDGEEEIDISAWNHAGKILTLAFPPKYELQVNDKLFMLPGDDKTLATCASKFSNSLNFVGAPFTAPPATLSEA